MSERYGYRELDMRIRRLDARIDRLWRAFVLSQALMGVAVLALYLRIVFP